MQLEGKVAVVLGASASGGTGWAIAEALAAEGAKVVVAARRIEPLQELADAIDGLAVVCDGAKQDQIRALSLSAVEAYGKIDIAINCAFFAGDGLIGDSDQDTLQTSLDVNFLGHVHFVRYMAEIMNDGGSITLISAQAAAQPSLGAFAYGCAKAATDCLVRYAAVEYGGRGIRVNSILPGPIKTSTTAPFLDRFDVNEAFMEQIPLGRLGLPKDYAQVVVWLAQPGFISGVNLPVSGGMHLNRIPVYRGFAQSD
ncbi:SDR family NAD(P)-dependent oxidoreductase [Rhizorhabdus argentea]|uniref:SDR family NAD(P)-dependent oxidoreductase n=1 Tax=Rhizorhabdus argentea TaxID=1387174 RepID=UPI0030ECD8F3